MNLSFSPRASHSDARHRFYARRRRRRRTDNRETNTRSIVHEATPRANVVRVRIVA